MKRNAMIYIFLSIILIATAAEPEYDTFGAQPGLTGKPLTLSDAIGGRQLNEMIRLEGRVTAVCRKKGCWMTLTDGKQTVRTTFKDYGFFVPKDISGKTVIAEGILSETTISESEARHFAEDAGQTPDEIQKITGDQKGFAFVAQCVLIPR